MTDEIQHFYFSCFKYAISIFAGWVEIQITGVKKRSDIFSDQLYRTYFGVIHFGYASELVI